MVSLILRPTPRCYWCRGVRHPGAWFHSFKDIADLIRYVSNSELSPLQFLTSHNKWQSDNALWFLSHATKKIKNIRPWESKRSFDAQLGGNLTGNTFIFYFKTVSDCGNICRVCSALTPKNVHTRTLSHGYRGFRQDFKDVHKFSSRKSMQSSEHICCNVHTRDDIRKQRSKTSSPRCII